MGGPTVWFCHPGTHPYKPGVGYVLARGTELELSFHVRGTRVCYYAAEWIDGVLMAKAGRRRLTSA